MQGHPTIVQQDGAAPLTGHRKVEFLKEDGLRDGWNIKVLTQPAESPHLKVNDLGFVVSLKCRVEHLKNEEANLKRLYESSKRHRTTMIQTPWNVFGVFNLRATSLFLKTREEIGTKLLIQGQKLGSHVG